MESNVERKIKETKERRDLNRSRCYFFRRRVGFLMTREVGVRIWARLASPVVVGAPALKTKALDGVLGV